MESNRRKRMKEPKQRIQLISLLSYSCKLLLLFIRIFRTRIDLAWFWAVGYVEACVSFCQLLCHFTLVVRVAFEWSVSDHKRRSRTNRGDVQLTTSNNATRGCCRHWFVYDASPLSHVSGPLPSTSWLDTTWYGGLHLARPPDNTRRLLAAVE